MPTAWIDAQTKEALAREAVIRAALKAKAQHQAIHATEGEPDPVGWITSRFFIPELNGPMTLADYQADALRRCLIPGPDGLLPYSTVVWSDIKKSAKSSIAAAVCLWWADTHPWSSIRIVANDQKQADSREAEYIRRAVLLNQKYFIGRRGAKITGYNVRLVNNSRIEAVPIDPRGEAGGGDDIVVFTELWGAKSKAHQEMWTEMTLSPLKFGDSFRWVETYAGHTGESTILEALYEQGVKQGRRLDEDIEMYANDAARLFCLWNTVPRLPWQTSEYYAQEAATLIESEFLRLHRNQWVSSVSEAIPVAWWDACRDPHIIMPPKHVPVVLGVDASVSGDCTALVAVARHPSQPGHVVQWHCRIWVPPKGGKMDYTSTLTAEVDRLISEHNVVQVAFDPYQLHHWATEQRAKEPGAWYKEFGQGTERLLSDKQLYDLVRDRRVHHTGDEDLRRHVQNCAAQIPKGEDNRLRFVKKGEAAKIDGAVALSMAAAECLRLNL